MTLIARVEQSGSSVYAYSVGGSLLWAHNGQLLNWTSREVAIKEGAKVYIYDADGNQIA